MKKFKERVCIVCHSPFIPTGSVQKVCQSCTNTYRTTYKRQWANINKERDLQNRKKWYWSNLQKLRDTKRRWNNSDKGIAYRKNYYITNKDKLTQIYDKYTTNEGSRIKARRLYIKAKMPLVCRMCGDKNKKVQIHHEDGDVLNNKLTNLIPLCVKDHKDLHRHKRLESDRNHVY